MDIYESLELLFDKIKKEGIDVTIQHEGVGERIGIGESYWSLVGYSWNIVLYKHRKEYIEALFTGLSMGKYKLDTEEGKRIESIFYEIWNWEQERRDIKKQKEIEETKKRFQQYIENYKKEEKIVREEVREEGVLQRIKNFFRRG